MDREEPKFSDKDVSDMELRPRGYRGPSRPERRARTDGLAWKMGVSIGIAVLAALLIFNAYERYQARKDLEQVVLELNKSLAVAENQSAQAVAEVRRQFSPPAAPLIKPVPPGFRCSNGVLLKRDPSGWTQITSRSRQLYCPPDGTVDDCYAVTPRSVGCGW